MLCLEVSVQDDVQKLRVEVVCNTPLHALGEVKLPQAAALGICASQEC